MSIQILVGDIDANVRKVEAAVNLQPTSPSFNSPASRMSLSGGGGGAAASSVPSVFVLPEMPPAVLKKARDAFRLEFLRIPLAIGSGQNKAQKKKDGSDLVNYSNHPPRCAFNELFLDACGRHGSGIVFASVEASYMQFGGVM